MKKISENIKAARKKKGWTQKQLADHCKWDEGQGRVSNYERDFRQPSVDDLYTISKALGVGIQELTGDYSIAMATPKVKSSVPLISWVQAGAWHDIIDVFQPGDADEYYPCPENHSPYTYALKVVGESMSPDFIEGEIIFVDPEVEARHGSCVIVRQNGNTESTFKQLIIDTDGKRLKALNPDWKPKYIELLPDAVISGVVIGSYRKRI
ncbi:LexA family protein [Catenovulum sediminis]|uniref:LexA family protein n=1 Tax=Catenovulum sediminis TaxID=1740262 RepID=UPI00117EFF04|nr:S24 family peptidase [Catenovulum sediminis]